MGTVPGTSPEGNLASAGTPIVRRHHANVAERSAVDLGEKCLSASVLAWDAGQAEKAARLVEDAVTLAHELRYA